MAEQQEVKFVISAVDQATRVLQGVASSLEGVGKSYLLLARATPIAIAATAIYKIASATLDAERASNRLNAALKATAYASGITRAELDAMAESLKGSTPFDDDEIRKGLASLIRFRDVQGDVFREAARLAPDLAMAIGTDLVGAYTLLGRVLEDPEKNLRGLREAGVNVTSTQERVNKVMKETGDIVAAQRIIIDDLAKSIGGAAAGENVGLYGAVKDVGKAFGDMFKGTGLAVKNWVAEQEVAMSRVRRIMELMSGAARAITPDGHAAKGPTQTELGDAMRGAGQQESSRLIAQTQAMVDKEVEKIEKARAEREKRLREDDINGWVAYADEVFRLADEENKAIEKIWDEHWKHEKEMRDEDLKGRSASIDAQIEAEDAMSRQVGEFMDERLKKTQKAAQDLGFTFASAFENAIVEGEKLRDVLKGLAQDILRIFVRKTVTEPLAGMLASAFTGAFGGAKATQHGGRRSAGELLMVGERGPELWIPDSSGTMIPNDRLGAGSGGVSITQNIHVDARSDIASVREAMRAAKDEAVAAVRDQVNRGGGYAAAFRG